MCGGARSGGGTRRRSRRHREATEHGANGTQRGGSRGVVARPGVTQAGATSNFGNLKRSPSPCPSKAPRCKIRPLRATAAVTVFLWSGAAGGDAVGECVGRADRGAEAGAGGQRARGGAVAGAAEAGGGRARGGAGAVPSIHRGAATQRSARRAAEAWKPRWQPLPIGAVRAVGAVGAVHRGAPPRRSARGEESESESQSSGVQRVSRRVQRRWEQRTYRHGWQRDEPVGAEHRAVAPLGGRLQSAAPRWHNSPS